MKESYRYKLIRDDGKYLYINTVKKAKINYDSNTALKQSASIELKLHKNEILPDNSKIQIIHVLNGVQKTLGTFLFATPQYTTLGQWKDYNLTCYSTLLLLQRNKLLNKRLVKKGTQVVQEIRRIMQELGYVINIQDSILATTIDIEFKAGTSYLDFINELLKIINYDSLYVDTNGVYTAKSHIDYIDRSIDLSYTANEYNTSLLKAYTIGNDTFNIPNIILAYVNSSKNDLKAVYENTNPQDKTSTANAPPFVENVEVMDCPDISTLTDIAKRYLLSKKSKGNTVKFYTSVNGDHGFKTCIQFNQEDYSKKLIENQWSLECETGAQMEHICEEVII